MVRRFWQKPRELWLRRALFQVYLWAGLLLGLYLLVVGPSGSLVVYKKEIERAMIPHLVKVPEGESRASFQAMYAAVAAPEGRIQVRWSPTGAALSAKTATRTSSWIGSTTCM